MADQADAAKLHITQDKYGFWMLSVEHDDGTMLLLAYQYPAPEHLIEDARELVTGNRYPKAMIMVAPPRNAEAAPSPVELDEYQVPEPKKVGDS